MLRANFERTGSNQTGYTLKAVKHGIQSRLGYKQVEGLTNAFQGAKSIDQATHLLSSKHVIILCL